MQLRATYKRFRSAIPTRIKHDRLYARWGIHGDWRGHQTAVLRKTVYDGR